MQDIAELERRISAALGRIGAGIEALATPAATGTEGDSRLAELEEQLAAERAANAALRAELSAPSGAADGTAHADLEARIERMTRQLDVQGIEMVRLRKTVAALRENLRAMRQLNSQHIGDAAAINRAMAVELDSIRVQRLSEVAELDEILSELEPLVTPAQEGMHGNA
jgi:hypothetical protein